MCVSVCLLVLEKATLVVIPQNLVASHRNAISSWKKTPGDLRSVEIKMKGTFEDWCAPMHGYFCIDMVMEAEHLWFGTSTCSNSQVLAKQRLSGSQCL